MFGEPALVARDVARDAQREALLAEQRVAAVAAAVRHDLALRRDVSDQHLLRVARPMVDDRSCNKHAKCLIFF